MKHMIALKLKELRKKMNYSIDDVADRLKEMNFYISPNTIYNYENGVSQPKADMFLSLCKIYNVKSFEIFFDDTQPETGKQETDKSEQRLLEAYRNHPEMQPAVNRILNIEDTSNTPRPIKPPISDFDSAVDVTDKLMAQIQTNKN